MVNTDFAPIRSNLRPPQIISLPMFVSSDSEPSSAQHSNASTPESHPYSTTSTTRPSSRSLDSSSSTSTISSTSSIPRSLPSLNLGPQRPLFDALSLPSTPLPEHFPSATSRPRSSSHSHSYTSTTSPMTPSDSSHLHPDYASMRAESMPGKRASYSALTEGFASLGSRRSNPSLRPSRTAEFSEEVRMEMRMFRD